MLQSQQKQTSFEEYLLLKKRQVDARLKLLLSSDSEKIEVLYEAMRYTVLARGKRFRPLLTMSVCEACGGNSESDNILNSAAAIEMIHSYSLIHDDLPCMDNDDYRRGQMSCHKKFGEDIALLTGNALLTLAFEVADPTVVRLISKAVGVRGLLSGQVADLLLQNHKIPKNQEWISYIYRHKTGDLIRTACLIGAHLTPHITQDRIDAIDVYGDKIGLAFQVIDDILDQDPCALYADKDEALQFAKQSLEEAKESLSVFDDGVQTRLCDLADFVASRTE